MTGFLRQRPIVSGIVALFVLVLLLTAFPIVPETKQAVVVRFGVSNFAQRGANA